MNDMPAAPPQGKPTVAIVVAVAANGVIGKDNQMPWHLPADLRNFKELTVGFPVVMGRKTYESIGKPLPGRDNIVITRKKGYEAPGCILADSLPDALAAAGAVQQVSIIGGSSVYQEALERKLVDIIYMTRIHEEFDGDVFFAPLPPDQWRKVADRPYHRDARNPLDFSFETYIRNA